MVVWLSPPRDPGYGIDAHRRGRIVVREGRLVEVERRVLPSGSSITGVWIDSHLRRHGSASDQCTLDYSGTRRTPGLLKVDYAWSGRQTTLASLQGTLAVLDHIARLRQCVATVAHISTWTISDRALRRFGWEPQAARLGGRHWIRRYYDGYPEHDLDRYCRRRSPARSSR